MAAKAISSHVEAQTLLYRECTTATSSKRIQHHRCCKTRGPHITAIGLHKLPKLNKDQGKAPLRHASWRLVSASASSAAPSLLDPAYRTKLAEEYGFTQIGEPVPPNVTMKNIMETLPPEVFKLNEWKAWKCLAISVSAYIAGLYCTAIAPWYLLPFAWAWTGTAVSGLFVVAHDCAHKSFSSNKLVEDIVGTISLMPLIYPYEAWRYKHDRHHGRTNMLHEDTAWIPIMKDEYEQSSKFHQTMLQLLMGPLRFWGTIYHWLDRHFNVDSFRPNERGRVKLSLGIVFGVMAIGWPLLIYLTGIKGWVNFWLMPWLGFHFWMSVITTVHHSAPHIGFNDAKTWHNAEAQLNGTVHCEYPKLLEFLFHDINVHVPHHISPKIPSYHLKFANDTLRKHWGKHINETTLNWRLMKTVCTQCHLYDEEKNYVPFDHGKEESIFLAAARRLMPNMA